MSDIEADILETLLGNGILHFNSLTSEEGDALERLRLRQWVQRYVEHQNNDPSAPVYYFAITDTGRLALADWQEARQQEAQRRAERDAREERQRREASAEAARNRRNVLISGIVSAIVSAVVSLLLNLFLR